MTFCYFSPAKLQFFGEICKKKIHFVTDLRSNNVRINLKKVKKPQKVSPICISGRKVVTLQRETDRIHIAGGLDQRLIEWPSAANLYRCAGEGLRCPRRRYRRGRELSAAYRSKSLGLVHTQPRPLFPGTHAVVREYVRSYAAQLGADGRGGGSFLVAVTLQDLAHL